jgi:two-component system, NarL family, invasion response regulator UvrY
MNSVQILEECLVLPRPRLTEREIQFLRLACSELTYKQIADRMCLSVRTIDGYRDSLFGKLQLHTRVGLVLYAIREGIFHLEREPALV